MPHHTIEELSSREIISIGKDAEKSNPHTLLVEIWNDAVTLEKFHISSKT